MAGDVQLEEAVVARLIHPQPQLGRGKAKRAQLDTPKLKLD